MEYEKVWRMKREKRNISIISKVKSFLLFKKVKRCFKKKLKRKVNFKNCEAECHGSFLSLKSRNIMSSRSSSAT